MRERELSALKGAGGFFCGRPRGWPTGWRVPGKPGGFCSLPCRAGSAASGRGPAGLAPDGAGWAAPCGGGEPPMKIGGLREDILFKSKEYPLALPKKESRGDFVFPPGTPLKRPKERPAGLSFGNLLGGGRGERGPSSPSSVLGLLQEGAGPLLGFRRLRWKEIGSFFAAACTWRKILLRPRV